MIHGFFEVSADHESDFRALLSSTHTPIDDDGSPGHFTAVFASRYSIGENHAGALAVVHWHDDPEGGRSIRLNFLKSGKEPLERPEPGTRSVQHLVGAATDLLGSFSASCTAVFHYHKSDGFRSNSSLPIVLPVQEHRGGVTHIEEATFVRREGDAKRYSIHVNETDDAFTHVVEFDKAIRLDRRSLTGVLVKASAYSTELVEVTEDDDKA